MRIAICDDTPDDQDILRHHLNEYMLRSGMEFELSFYESGESLLTALKKTSYQIIFLDIYMLGLNGIDTAKEIRKFDKEVQIIFITTSPDHAVSSYDVRALHYVMKPISFSKMEKVLNLCKLEAAKESRQIEIMSGKRITSVKLTDILYVEMYQKILSVHTVHGTLQSRTSLENFEILLGGIPFLRCHRSFVVNMDYIEDLDRDAFLLPDGQKVPISRPARMLAQKTYNEYIFSGMRQKLC